jgi:hypothetical protein
MTNERHEKALEAAEWIEHDGRSCPVDPETMVLVKFRDDSPHYSSAGSERPARQWHHSNPQWSNWIHQNTPADIVAYRVFPNHFTNGE